MFVKVVKELGDRAYIEFLYRLDLRYSLVDGDVDHCLCKSIVRAGDEQRDAISVDRLLRINPVCDA